MTTQERIERVRYVAEDVAGECKYYAPWLYPEDAELAKKLDALADAAVAVADYIADRRR
jgi:hypothetical protein